MSNGYLQKISVQPQIAKISSFLLMGLVLFVGLFSGLLIYHLELVGSYIIIGTIVSPIVFLTPYRGLFIIIIAFPFMVGFSEGVDIAEYGFVLIFSIWLIGWLIRLLLDKAGRMTFSWHPISKPTLAIFALLITGAIVGMINGASFLNIFRDLSQYVGYILILPVASIVRKQKSALKILIILFLIGLPCWVYSSFIWWARKFGSEYATMNIAGIGTAYMGPFIGALWPFLFLKTKRSTKIIAGFFLIIYAIYTIGSGYRSAIIAFLTMTSISAGLLWITYKGIRKAKAVPVLILGIIFLVWFYYGMHGSLPLPGGERARMLYSSLISPSKLSEDLSFQGRMIEAEASLETFKKYPVLGQGFGHHVEMFWKHGRWYETSYIQHFWPAEILRKFGILGSLIFIWYFISILKLTFNLAKKTDNLITKGISFGILVWIATNLLLPFGSFTDRGYIFTVGVIIGMLPALIGIPLFFKKTQLKNNGN